MSLRDTNSIEIWRGKSLVTGDPIVVLLAGLRRSDHRTTGAMLQTYILHRDQDPNDAICPPQALAIWWSWRMGTIAPSSITEIKTRIQDRKVRIGTYGDPAAVPARVWTALIRHTAGHTGYTHQ